MEWLSNVVGQLKVNCKKLNTYNKEWCCGWVAAGGPTKNERKRTCDRDLCILEFNGPGMRLLTVLS